MGQDLLSDENDQIISLRNGNVLTPDYHFIGSGIYDTATEENVVNELEAEELERLNEMVKKGQAELINSDKLLNLDLMRFYSPIVLKDWTQPDYQYQNQMEHLSKHPNRGLSLLNQSNGVSKRSLYKSNAPELPENQIDNNITKTTIS